MALDRHVPPVEILTSFMQVIDQACAYKSRPGVINHANIGAYEEAFLVMKRLGLIESLGSGDYQLNYDGLTQFIKS